MRQWLLQLATAILLQNSAKIYYKMCQVFLCKMWQFYFKMWRLLQNEILLQNAVFPLALEKQSFQGQPFPVPFSQDNRDYEPRLWPLGNFVQRKNGGHGPSVVTPATSFLFFCHPWEGDTIGLYSQIIASVNTICY